MPAQRAVCIEKENVLAESILLTMARNANKLHNKIQKGKTKKKTVVHSFLIVKATAPSGEQRLIAADQITGLAGGHNETTE